MGADNSVDGLYELDGLGRTGPATSVSRAAEVSGANLRPATGWVEVVVVEVEF